MPTFTPVFLKTVAAAAVLSLAMTGGAQAQQQRPAKGAAPAVVDPGPDMSSEMTQRILALEHLVEQLTGQIEELRFNNDRTTKQLQTLQDDVSLRLTRIEQSLGLTGAPAAAPAAAAPAPGPQGQATPSPAAGGGADALSEPVRAAAPAAGQTADAGPPEGVNNNGGFVIRTDSQGRPLPPDPNQPQTPPPAAPPPNPQQAAPKAAPGAGPVSSGQVASLPPANVTLPDGTPKQQYEFAFDFLKKQDYPRAESALRQFLKTHPKDPLAGNAQYWLGETYYVRGDFQQAAVEFMAGYQNYPKTNKGPDNLLKLGMSMSKLNQKDGACTALSRINKDYPDAPDQVLKQAQGERTKLKCK